MMGIFIFLTIVFGSLFVAYKAYEFLKVLPQYYSNTLPVSQSGDLDRDGILDYYDDSDGDGIYDHKDANPYVGRNQFFNHIRK